MSWKVLEGLAVLLYGALTLVLLFIFSLWHDAFYATASTILAAALTYIFQVYIVDSSDADGYMAPSAQQRANVLQAVIMATVAVAFILALLGV